MSEINNSKLPGIRASIQILNSWSVEMKSKMGGALWRSSKRMTLEALSEEDCMPTSTVALASASASTPAIKNTNSNEWRKSKPSSDITQELKKLHRWSVAVGATPQPIQPVLSQKQYSSKALLELPVVLEEEESGTEPSPSPLPPADVCAGVVPPPPPLDGDLGPGMAGAGASAGAGMGRKKKPSKKPARPMKLFHWSRLPDNRIEGTVWMSLSDEAVAVDVPALEDLFLNRSAVSGAAAAVAAAGAERVQLLDARRLHAVGIMLSAYGAMGPEDVAAAVERCDLEVLTPERLRLIYRNYPDEEEVEVLSTFTGDSSKLSKSERFLLSLVRIPRVETRLRSLVYWYTTEEVLEYLAPSYTILSSAVEALQASPALASVLQLVLAHGNYLNGGMPQGGAYGFRLDTLAKLGDFRVTKPKAEAKAKAGEDGSGDRDRDGDGDGGEGADAAADAYADSHAGLTTLLHYLVHRMRLEGDLHSRLAKELVFVGPAANLSVTSLAEDMQELSVGLNQLTNEIAASKALLSGTAVSSSSSSSASSSAQLTTEQAEGIRVFLSSITPFYEGIVETYKELASSRAEAEGMLRAIVAQYGEDPLKMPAEEFLQIFPAFVANITRIAQELDEKEKRERAAAERAQTQAARKKGQKNKAGKSSGGGGGGGAGGGGDKQTAGESESASSPHTRTAHASASASGSDSLSVQQQQQQQRLRSLSTPASTKAGAGAAGDSPFPVAWTLCAASVLLNVLFIWYFRK